MILRRVREHVVRHNWFAVLVDLAIVIIGVFVGTQASNWNQDRLDRRQARENRAMLIDDLRENRRDLAMRKSYFLWVRGEALKTLSDFQRPPSQLDQAFLVDAYQASQIIPWSLKRNTYDQLIASGQFAHVGDAALRDRISNYYVASDITGANIATVTPYRETLRRTMAYAAQLQIRTLCGEKIGENARGESTMTLPGACSIHIAPVALRSAIEQVRGAPGLSLDLNRLLVDVDQKLISVDVISRRAQALERTLNGSRDG